MWLKRLIIALALTAPLFAQHSNSVNPTETLTTTPSVTALKNQGSPTEFFCVNDSLTATIGDIGSAEVTHQRSLYQAPVVKLSWAAATANWYKVYRSTVSGGPYTLVADCIGGLAYTDTTVVPATPYFYVVTSVYQGNESAYSGEVRAGVWPDALVNRTQVLQPRTATESLTTTPSVAARQTLRRNPNETLTTTPSIARSQTLARSPTETNGTTDSLSVQGPHNKSASIGDSVSESDSIQRSTRDARAPSETLTTNDAITTVRKTMTRQMLQLTLAENLPPVPCDPAQIEQVLLALIMNAVDAMPRGGTLWLATRMSRNETEMEIQVRDDGSGIAPDVLPQIFEPFMTTKENGRGVGLGLAISRGIMERHNGRIAVESELGRGTTFTVTLPFPVSEDSLAGVGAGTAATKMR